MIDTAISHLAGQLNQHLKSVFALNEDVVVISNILEQDGSLAANINNKIVVFLINVEHDTTPFRQPSGNHSGANRAVVQYPPIYLNLYLMFAGHFTGKNYPEALKFIANTMSYFQGHPVFDHRNSPDLDKRIDKLTLDIENLNLKDLGTLWGALSNKYLPSILYKVRMVAIDSQDVKRRVATAQEPATSIGHG